MTPKEIGETVANARNLKGWSQEKLADEAGGIGQSTVDRVEKGDFKRMPSHLPQICGALGIPLPALGNGNPVGRPIYAPPRPGVADFPVYSAAEGGPGEIIVTADPIAFLPRPAPLAHVKDSYGLNITGTSMIPEYNPGETALVNPLLPPVGGEVHIFYAERAGEARATIKQLRRVTATEWLVHQHNPAPRKPQDFALTRREWQWAHRVIGKYSRQ
jgi:transcriptional regulator with XRE-family HTH domain